jgi:hypothetical protein
VGVGAQRCGVEGRGGWGGVQRQDSGDVRQAGLQHLLHVQGGDKLPLLQSVLSYMHVFEYMFELYSNTPPCPAACLCAPPGLKSGGSNWPLLPAAAACCQAEGLGLDRDNA